MKRQASIPGTITKDGLLRCVLCGSEQSVERNHPGGRNQIAWFTMPFCRPHHDEFHVMLRVAGINLEYTSDPVERSIRALEACRVAEWMILQALRKNGSKPEWRRHV